MAVQAAPAVIADDKGIPVVNTTNGTPFTVSSKGIGTPLTVVAKNGIPVTLLNEDGTAWVAP